MKKIFKYHLPVFGQNKVRIPFNGYVRAVGQQSGVVTLWIEVWPNNSEETRVFYVYGTGHELGFDEQYLGTAFCDPFVWHVYENVNERDSS